MPHWIHSRIAAGATLIATGSLLAGALTSCANYTGCDIERLDEGVKASDLNGRYVGSEYGTLDLEPKGQLNFHDWRHYDTFSGLDGESIEIPSGTGTWKLTRTGKDDEVEVSLVVSSSVSKDRDVTYELLADGSADDPTLYQFHGDPDSCDLNTLKRE
ncbi:hypothetical protein [Streptomyces phytophilus]|uniref:hypothetical protein n=1 Tax=Streptomyces phytophilus TaxID=722715 RepID=UPI0015F05CBA|nr:hypothetical protein [Streptomyces phytophilus]